MKFMKDVVKQKYKYVSEYPEVRKEKENRKQALKKALSSDEIERSEILQMLSLLLEQSRFQQAQYWNHFGKLLVLILILVALPQFIRAGMLREEFLKLFPLIPMFFSVFAFFGLKGEEARLHYINMKISALEESLSIAYSESDSLVAIFTSIPLLKKTNRYYPENYGLILFVLTFIGGIAELIFYNNIFK
jgi:hypothetical protein